MRFPTFFAAGIALLCASPAAADISARYRTDQATVTAQVNMRGDSRTQVNDATYLTRDGIDYLIGQDERGTFVVRLDDFTAMMRDMRARLPRDRPVAPGAGLSLSRTGTETVGGRTGDLYRLADSSGEAMEIVVSTDAELAPLGRALSGHFAQMIDAMTAEVPEVGEALRGVLGRGALLRIDNLWRLESVETATTLPISTFELPAPPISRAELEERFGVPPVR